MLLPSIFNENLFDDFMDFPMIDDYGDINSKLYGKHANRVMKTDVHETADSYQVDIDLPGFKKDQIDLHLENGYLYVSATKGLEKETGDEKKVLRKERYSGTMQRSYYVGEGFTEDDVKAEFEDGVLRITLPKKQPEAVNTVKRIAIEG